MSDHGKTKDHKASESGVTIHQAEELLASVPPRPKRQLELRDHLNAIATIVMSFSSGLLALSGHPWWAILPAVAAIMVSNFWITKRRSRPNEPRFKIANTTTVMFTVWLTLPIWRGITRGDTAPFPESLIFAGLAPSAWLLFYIILLVRR